MARKPKDVQTRLEEIVQKSMEDVMRDSMLPYSEHVILERALPRVEDGRKPGQRRILYTMQELGLSPDKPHRKCARIVGDCLGKYHPHGDSSVYDALVRLAQPFVMRAPLVDGHGNFGSVDGDGAAAMRYTEARMAPLAIEMLRDIEKDTVDFQLNFDDTQKEPVLLPSRFPNLLVNGASGIAVGLATNIPPHNFGEVIDGTIALMENPQMTTGELMRYMPAPDFPTGGILALDGEIESAYETGRDVYKRQEYVLIDTAGIRRKRAIAYQSLERFSVVRSLAAIDRANVVLFLIDATQGVTEQDAKIAGYVDEQGKAAIIVVNKWDAVEKQTGTLEEFTRKIRTELKLSLIHI